MYYSGQECPPPVLSCLSRFSLLWELYVCLAHLHAYCIDPCTINIPNLLISRHISSPSNKYSIHNTNMEQLMLALVTEQ